MIALIFILGTGCAALDNEFGRIGAHSRSYRLENSRVVLRLLEGDDLKPTLDQAIQQAGDAFIRPANAREASSTVLASNAIDNATLGAAFTAPGPAAAILSAAVDTVVGLVSEEIKRDAERYTYSYNATETGSGAWIRNDVSPRKAANLKYQGFVLERYTDDGLAMRLIAVLHSTTEGKYLVRPVFLHMSRSAAKVALGDSVTLEATLSGKTVAVTGADGKPDESELGTFTRPLPTMRLNTARLFWHDTDRPTIGMIGMPAVPVFADDAKAPLSAGILELTVAITEKDTRNHKPDRLKAAQFVDDNAEQLADIIRRALGIKKPEKE